MRRARLLATLLVLALLGVGAAVRDRAIVHAPMTAIVFDHQDHPTVSCATCHHNFFDGTGTDSCYFCHKQRPELARTVQRDFHELCRGCHTRIATAGWASGPLRRCDGCHDWTVTQAVVPVEPAAGSVTGDTAGP